VERKRQASASRARAEPPKQGSAPTPSAREPPPEPRAAGAVAATLEAHPASPLALKPAIRSDDATARADAPSKPSKQVRFADQAEDQAEDADESERARAAIPREDESPKRDGPDDDELDDLSREFLRSMGIEDVDGAEREQPALEREEDEEEGADVLSLLDASFSRTMLEELTTFAVAWDVLARWVTRDTRELVRRRRGTPASADEVAARAPNLEPPLAPEEAEAWERLKAERRAELEAALVAGARDVVRPGSGDASAAARAALRAAVASFDVDRAVPSLAPAHWQVLSFVLLSSLEGSAVVAVDSGAALPLPKARLSAAEVALLRGVLQ